METRSQRRERIEVPTESENISERLVDRETSSRPIEYIDEQIHFVESLQAVKNGLNDIKQSETNLKEKYERICGENQQLVERIKLLEARETENRLSQLDLETNYHVLEEKIGKLTEDLQRTRTGCYQEIGRRVETSNEEVQSLRVSFAESFEQLLDVVEKLDKRVQSSETSLQCKIDEMSEIRLSQTPINAKKVPKVPKAQSTEMKSEKPYMFRTQLPPSAAVDSCLDKRTTASSDSKQRKQKPIQTAPKFDGDSSWEVFQAQFDIAAEINGWNEDDKAVFLATALVGKAALVLSNLSDRERRDYRTLVSTLTTCFGMAHQSELARAKLKCRGKNREESMAELAESVETLTRTAYPDASTDLQDVIARDNFIDALPDDDMRLRIRQLRPSSLQVALQNAMELESFHQASRHRQRWQRSGSSWNVRQVEETSRIAPKTSEETSSIERLEKLVDQLLKEMKNQNRRQSPPRTSGRPRPMRCWNCGQLGHLQNDCLVKQEEIKKEFKKETEVGREGAETSQGDRNIKHQGNDRWSSERGMGRPRKF
ncbi:uncharacterized protein LOC114544926 [Dendronephthya gigantea]|uniref:uncharacterized protein LOC114544926 n=1 Tax=Dendronephthya gigantea TaxID=151771 RepID=UPI00106A4B59|nr:uncharacterized protein LOC114544926 [Dendronephthya gigantea]